MCALTWCLPLGMCMCICIFKNVQGMYQTVANFGGKLWSALEIARVSQSVQLSDFPEETGKSPSRPHRYGTKRWTVGRSAILKLRVQAIVIVYCDVLVGGLLGNSFITIDVSFETANGCRAWW